MALYSVDEVFQIAIQIEQAGQIFYETVARASISPVVAQMCRHLAGQENVHIQQFSAMRDAAVEKSEKRRMPMEKMEFVQAMTQDEVLPMAQEAKRVASECGLDEVLEMAIRMENDAVAFYTELLEAVDEQDAAGVRAIIDQEKAHAIQLTEARAELEA